MQPEKMTRAKLIDEVRSLRKEVNALKQRKSNPELIKSRNAALNLLEDLQNEVNERKRISEILRISEETYRLAMQATRDGVWDWDLSTDVVYYSPSWARILEEKKVEPVKKTWEIRIHPDDKKRVLDSLRKHLEGKTESWQEEHRLRTKSGQYKWVLGRGEVVSRDSQNIPYRMIGTMKDISDRKKIEADLAESERRLRSFLEQTSDSIFCYEYSPPISVKTSIKRQIQQLYEGVLTECNEICALSYGAQKSEDVIGRKLTENFGTKPGSLDAFFREFIQNDYRSINQEGEEIQPDNSKRYYLNNAYGIVENGKLLRIWGFYHDITDQKLISEALQESEEKYRLLFNNANDIVLIHQYTDDKLPDIFLDVNQKAVEVLGYTREELLQMTPMDVISKDQLLEVAKSSRKLRRDKESLFERTVVTKAGKEIPVEIHSRLFHYKGKPTTLSICRDITDRKRAEKTRKREHDLIQNITETSPIGIVQVNREGHVVFANRRAEEILHLSKSELKDRTYNDPEWQITDYHGNPFPEEQLPFNQVQKTGKSVSDVQHAIQWPDGDRCLLSINAAPLFNEQGQFESMVAAIEDVTERKQADMALQESENRYRELFNHMSSGVAVYEVVDGGRDFIFKDFNQAGEKIDGQSKEFLIGKSVFDVRPGVEEFGLIHAFRQVIETGEPISHPITLYHDNQLTGWYENYIYPLPSGELVAVFDDVTEKKQAEEALTESEFRLRQMADTIEDVFWIVEWQTKKTIFASKSFETLWGISLESLYDKQDAWAGAIHSDDKQAAWDNFINLRNGKSYDEVYRIIRPDKDIRWIRDRGYPILDEKANVIRVVGIAQDITESKQAEIGILESENKFRSLFENTSSMIVLHDMDGNFIDVNQPALDNWGYSKEEFLNLNVSIMDKDSVIRKDSETRWQDLDEKTSIRFESNIQRKDGSICPMEIILNKFKLQGKPIIMAVSRDFTERKKAEDAMREREVRYRTLFQQAGDAIFIMEQYQFTECNDHAAEMYGFKTSSNFVGGNPWQISPVNQPDGRPSEEKAKALIDEALEGRILHFYWQHRKKDGALIDTEVTLTPFDIGQKRYIQAIVRDITKRLQAEEAIEQHRKELQRLSEQLIHTQEEERKRLSRELHDEMGQSLTGIKLNLTSFENKMGDAVPAPIVKDIKEAEQMVEDLLDKMHDIALNLRPSMLDDLGLIPAVKWLVNYNRKRWDFDIKLRHSGLKQRLNADFETAIYRIIQESLNNIAKHARAKRVTIQVRKLISKRLRLRITDDGCGFNVKHIEQQDPSKRGVGILGMQERAANLGGTFRLESNPKQGTSIEVELPV